MLGSKFIKFLMSILKWQVNSSSNFASFFIVMTHNSSVDFKLIPFLLWIKGSHQSPNFETFKCSGENLAYFSCHFPNHKSGFLQILHHPVSWKITPLYFFRSNNKYFPQKEPMKMQIFETFECSGQNLPNSCHFWNNRSVFLQISHQSSGSWDITPLHFLAKILYAIKVKIWWNFTWAVQSLKFCTLLLCSNFAPFAQIMYSFS